MPQETEEYDFEINDVTVRVRRNQNAQRQYGKNTYNSLVNSILADLSGFRTRFFHRRNDPSAFVRLLGEAKARGITDILIDIDPFIDSSIVDGLDTDELYDGFMSTYTALREDPRGGGFSQTILVNSNEFFRNFLALGDARNAAANFAAIPDGFELVRNPFHGEFMLYNAPPNAVLNGQFSGLATPYYGGYGNESWRDIWNSVPAALRNYIEANPYYHVIRDADGDYFAAPIFNTLNRDPLRVIANELGNGFVSTFGSKRPFMEEHGGSSVLGNLHEGASNIAQAFYESANEFVPRAAFAYYRDEFGNLYNLTHVTPNDPNIDFLFEFGRDGVSIFSQMTEEGARWSDHLDRDGLGQFILPISAWSDLHKRNPFDDEFNLLSEMVSEPSGRDDIANALSVQTLFVLSDGTIMNVAGLDGVEFIRPGDPGYNELVSEIESADPEDPDRPQVFSFAEIGSLFGSILGSTLAGGSGELGDSFKSVLFSSVGAQLGGYIGEGLATDPADLFLALDIGVEETIRAFPTTLGASAVSAASGYVSTMLTDELIAAIGIRGEAATLLDSLGSDYTSRIAKNLQPPEDFDLQTAGNASLVSPTQVYGHTAGDLWVPLRDECQIRQRHSRLSLRNRDVLFAS